MITYTDGTLFNGKLEVGQVWVKGNREKTIVGFDAFYMYYKTKTDIKKGTTTGVRRSVFRDWVTSGAMLKK
ncbi:hypothetical protein vBBak6_074 [Bacillus phage v_B-Bak6]|uniref:Uncharacterized protein n=1 Tax=Bacillus phage Basilisk TaxID=1296654 RepID=S5MS66_9CAUD|nr:hypothetical protein PP653_gp084 [Bacillus phage Basilisk]AGR46627.1 hypothetical protein BASILISK_83 [Bacillus phage Basilisk]AXY83034.1 hypothetical protein vBBak1_074 [Bacillus phage v_B-Bak1]AXY83154.1 hypothetical protein vBBak6_074 [Bacillus phage v_B-Bak6]